MIRRGFAWRESLIITVIILVFAALFLPIFEFLVEVPFTLAFGWVKYLWRVVPKLSPDSRTVCTAIVCLAGVIVGSQYFLRWLAGPESHWPWKRTLRVVGLIVLMFVAGIALVGMVHQTIWLARSPEPLIQGGIRWAAARMNSKNNLKQIALAATNYKDDKAPKELPRSSFNPAGQPMHSWQTAILPYIEQNHLYRQIDLTKPWAHPANASVMSEQVKTYLNPAIEVQNVNGFGASHYAGNIVVVLGDAKTIRSFPQGASNTILAGEVSSDFQAWGDPLNARDPRLGSTGHPHGFGGPNNRPAQFSMLDGSVRTFDPKELAELVGKVPD